MPHFIAISDQNRGEPFTLFEGETLDYVFEQAANWMGGHPAIEAGLVRARGTYDAKHGRHYVRNPAPLPVDVFPGDNNPDDPNPLAVDGGFPAMATSDETRSFWFQVMADLFEGQDNSEWFTGTDRAAVEREAIAYHAGSMGDEDE